MLKFGFRMKSRKEILGIAQASAGGVKSFVGKIPVEYRGANVPDYGRWKSG